MGENLTLRKETIMMKTLVIVIIGLALVFGGVGQVYAVPIVVYPVTSANAFTNPTVAPSSVAPGVNAGNIFATGNLTNPLNLPGSFAWENWETGGSADPSKYIGFSLSAQAGNSITYNTISYGVISDASPPRGPRQWELQASTDGFGSSIILLDSFTLTIHGSIRRAPIDISSIGNQAGTVDFRLFGFNGSAAKFGGLFQGSVDSPPQIDLSIDGTVIPVPTTIALLGIGLVGLAGGAARRKWKKKAVDKG